MVLFPDSVKFVDQFGLPVPGVEIRDYVNDVQNVRYISDENGIISFPSKLWDPSLVHFSITQLPIGYDYVDTSFDKRLTFPTDSRTITIELQSKTEVYNVFVYWVTDGISSIMPGTEFTIYLGGRQYFCTVNSKGECTVELPYFVSESRLSIAFTYLPEKYQEYEIESIEVGGNTGFMYLSIHLGPMDDGPDT